MDGQNNRNTDSRSSRSTRGVASSAAVVALTGRGWSANAIAVRFSRNGSRRRIARARISAVRAAWSRSRQDAFKRLVGSPPELPPPHQTATPCDHVRNSPRSARGAVRACNRWRAAGRAGRPRRDRSPPRGAPVRRRRPQCHGHAGSPRPRCQPDWLWRSRSCRPRAPP